MSMVGTDFSHTATSVSKRKVVVRKARDRKAERRKCARALLLAVDHGPDAFHLVYQHVAHRLNGHKAHSKSCSYDPTARCTSQYTNTIRQGR